MEETLNFKQNPSISRTSAMHMVCRLCSALICVFWRYSLDFKIDGATHVDLVIKTIGLHIEIPCKRHWIRCTSWRRFKLSKINLTMFRMSLLSLNMKCFFPSPPPPRSETSLCRNINYGLSIDVSILYFYDLGVLKSRTGIDKGNERDTTDFL